jgi:secreted trypsin-like serine protease
VFVWGWGCDASRAGTTGCTPGLDMVIPRNGANDACSGDSGGPVLEPTDGGWRVVALVSRSIAGALLPCGDGGIYGPRLDFGSSTRRSTS